MAKTSLVRLVVIGHWLKTEDIIGYVVSRAKYDTETNTIIVEVRKNES